ncbi:nuclease-related domain-containing protein [Streptomyces sp. CA-253872]|uniref:nuclease-related domain-containing protein n=1 Tax=Streptomyces sp. CA-253872 TaxID=3240067 RepID=UPI003D9464F7
MTLLTLAAIAAAVWWWRYRRPAAGAGASAEARARALLTPWVRIAERLGIRTQAAALARRSRQGAEGERRTAALLAPLAREGWHVYHDLAVPGRGRMNVDHLLISPAGHVVLPDSKKWSARQPVTIRAGRLLHGTADVTARLNGLRAEIAAVSEILGVPVTPLVVMHDAPLVGPRGRTATSLDLAGIRIVPAARLLAHLRTPPPLPAPRRPVADLAHAVTRRLPAYTRYHQRP